MANNLFVTKFRKIPHIKPSTNAGSLFGKDRKGKKSVKAKLQKLLHFFYRLRPRELPPSESPIQVTTVEEESAGRIAFELCRELITSGDINLSLEQIEREGQNSPGSEVDLLGEALAQALFVYQQLPVSPKSYHSDVLRHRVNEERRLIAVNFPIGPIPQSPRSQGLTRLAAKYPIPQRPQKMVKIRVTASTEHECEETQGMIEFSTTPPDKISTPSRHMVDENGDDVTDEHPYISTFRQATIVDSILLKGRPTQIFGQSAAEKGEAIYASGFANAAVPEKDSPREKDASDIFWNPKENDALARAGVGKTPGRLWGKLAAAKYGVEASPDRGFAHEYELLSADQVQAARTELQDSLGQDDPSHLLLRALTSNYKTPNDKKQESPDETQFRDSGYVSPFKETPTGFQNPGTTNTWLDSPRKPTQIDPATTVENLSLVLVPSKTSRVNVESLSPNEIDCLTIEFANQAIKYLDLGLDYMVEQSNMELHAQRNDRNGACTDQIPVSISDILSRVALMRPHVQGTPAVSRTRDFEAPAAAIELDDRLLLNLPEAEKGCVLRIGVGKNGRVAYYLNLMIPVRGFDNRMQELTIVSQMDVTLLVERLALQEYFKHQEATESARSLTMEPGNWFGQAFNIEGVLKRALTASDEDFTEQFLGPPSRQIRRLLAFFLQLGSEHQECVVFAGKKPLGWDDIHWQTYWVTRDIRDNEDDDNLMYEKSIEEEAWSQIQCKLDDEWESFAWPDTISWGKDGEQRRAYFIPMADRWSIGEEEREKWWLMFLSDFDEDAWAEERFV
ncbi:hypothetical protein EG327_009238 [Venturia inaequalis]|uniref:Uncharacterized protein n=1 Tax=Venturia inaequalis TaxID=5025 RepID=A0A8H3VSZ8_VENIN|nr:hypothetical protein EG327_009238 [Venturia inaequalis]